jgi:hypothetical protein
MGNGGKKCLGSWERGVELLVILVAAILIIWADHVPLDIIGSVSNIYDTSYIYLFTIVYMYGVQQYLLYIFLLYYNGDTLSMSILYLFTYHLFMCYSCAIHYSLGCRRPNIMTLLPSR